MNLHDQIFDCLPAGTYALTSLLQVVDVVETREVPTAAVECSAAPRLLVNPDFVARHAPTPETLTMLVLHELHHVLLGHTRRFGRATAEDNFVFDAVINALLCRMFPAREYTALFRGFYPADQFPACLLRPAEGWQPGSEWRLPAVFDAGDPHLRRAGEVYRALYSAGGATYDEVRSVLPGALRASGVALGGVPLLGGHDSESGEASAASPELTRIATELVAQWPSPPDPIAGRSLESLLAEARVVAQRPADDRERLRRLIGCIARAGAVRAGPRRRTTRTLRVESPLPVANRRSAVLGALGTPPLLFEHELSQTRNERGIAPLHVYVDVSGSVQSIKGALYGAVLDCEGLVHRQVHLFSTAVHSVSWADFRRGVCRSTGGTSIRCVAEHIARHGVDRAVLVTDGEVGGSERDRRLLAQARLGVAYTRQHQTHDLQRVTAASCVLDI